jgi:Protein of unknown function (DUF4058)/Protein of unknown function (DUF2934)
MANPFPGMNPLLENADIWPAFHHQLITALQQILLPGLDDRYRSRIVERRYAPDSRGECMEEYIEIVERNGGDLVTLVDVVSPANKTTEFGRQAYLETRTQARVKNASVVEIDLTLQGRPTLDYSRDGLPEWDYAVSVTRASQPERYEIYTAMLQKRLPRFKIPLASTDRDTVLDLQETFARVYDQGGFAGKIDFGREPATGLADGTRQRLREWLDQVIALAAYDIWKEQGCPDGRADEHWRLAIERLKR